MAAREDAFAPLPEGLFPVMLTPFRADGEVDLPCLEVLTRWYLASGAAGLFPVAQSGEMFELSPDERLRVAACVKRTAGPAVSVVACGTFAETVEEQAKFVRQMAAVVDVVVVIVSKLAARDEGDDVVLRRLQQLVELTPGIPLGLYECPVPYHRLLSQEAMRWIAQSGRFLFIKDTSRDNGIIDGKLGVVQQHGGPFRWYNGNVTTMLHSLRAGGHGYGGVSANMYPWVHAWVIRNHRDKGEEAEKLQRFLTVAESLVKSKYPASAKMFLRLLNPGFLISTHCRNRDNSPFLSEEVTKLRELKAMMEAHCHEAGIPICCPDDYTPEPSAGGAAPVL